MAVSRMVEIAKFEVAMVNWGTAEKLCSSCPISKVLTGYQSEHTKFSLSMNPILLNKLRKRWKKLIQDDDMVFASSAVKISKSMTSKVYIWQQNRDGWQG